MIQNHKAMMEILQKLSFINDAYDVYDSHTKIMFACGEQSVEDVLWDHRWSVVLYKHKLAWYGYTKSLQRAIDGKEKFQVQVSDQLMNSFCEA